MIKIYSITAVGTHICLHLEQRTLYIDETLQQLELQLLKLMSTFDLPANERPLTILAIVNAYSLAQLHQTDPSLILLVAAVYSATSTGCDSDHM